MKKWLKRIGLGVIALIIIFCVWNFQLIRYGLFQLRGQLHVVNNTIPLDEYIANPSTPDSLRQKALLVDQIRSFAFDSLAINYSDNYTEIFDQQGKASMYVVTACDPYSFTPKTWKFPIVGNFPYKGFFDRQKAVDLANEIKAKDSLDVGLRTAGGWSTLGWFKDPILSNMLNRSEGDLASLLIHELTHGTLFVKDSVTFNENLASFIGDRGAIMYLSSKYGEGAPEVLQYQSEIVDEELFKAYILEAAKSLDSLYTSMKDLPIVEKKELKKNKIDQIRTNFGRLGFKSEVYKGFFETYVPNNTFFMSYLRYNSQQQVLRDELNLKYQGDLKRYLEYLKSKYPSL
ncbi:aminopeptidase [Roseivirga sp.]|uniref:aminopeptidase n=1 Tax=Roseivirga sp. TaxID=1964215 RepID=UPI002B27A6E2|nr:aminopeptidase [Roseivirga sp.]